MYVVVKWKDTSAFCLVNEYGITAKDRRGNTRTFGNIDAARKVADKLNGEQGGKTD